MTAELAEAPSGGLLVLCCAGWRRVHLCSPGVVHEHPRIGSDGESEEGSGTSDDPNVSPGSEELATNGKQVNPPLLIPTLTPCILSPGESLELNGWWRLGEVGSASSPRSGPRRSPT